MAKRIEAELNVKGIDEGFYVSFANGTGMWYSERQFKDYLKEQMESGNEILFKPGKLRK
jgi:hypothetical protein